MYVYITVFFGMIAQFFGFKRDFQKYCLTYFPVKPLIPSFLGYPVNARQVHSCDHWTIAGGIFNCVGWHRFQWFSYVFVPEAAKITQQNSEPVHVSLLATGCLALRQYPEQNQDRAPLPDRCPRWATPQDSVLSSACFFKSSKRW